MITDRHRALIAEAKELERRRIEITALALEQSFVDLLPEPWANLVEIPMEHESVEIRFHTGLTEADGQRFTARDCRSFVAFVGKLADEQRHGERLRRLREEGDDDGA